MSPVPADLRGASPRDLVEALLVRNLLPFWSSPDLIDQHHGGFRLNHDRHGRWRGPAEKHMVTQARTTWFFAELAASSFAPDEHGAAALHGLTFLTDRLWDEEHPGFRDCVDYDGRPHPAAPKRLYMQAFGLFAITACARLTGEAALHERAREVAALIEERFHDPQHGGYFDLQRSAPASDRAPKSANANLHVLEALIPYNEVTGDPIARSRIQELAEILSARVLVAPGAAVDHFDEQWQPVRGSTIPYGHNIEAAWLLLDAANAAHADRDAMLSAARARLDYALRFGFDHRRGGFYSYGPLKKAATGRTKVWWVQAEGLLCARMLADATADERYEDAFRATLRWIAEEQADWRHGDWHRDITRFRRFGLKAGPWQDPYHQGRALLRVLQSLDAPRG